jgi:hypothetical protein
VEREIPEVSHKITHIEGCIEGCIGGCLDNAEKLQFQSTLERVENEGAQLRRQEEERRRSAARSARFAQTHCSDL